MQHAQNQRITLHAPSLRRRSAPPSPPLVPPRFALPSSPLSPSANPDAVGVQTGGTPTAQRPLGTERYVHESAGKRPKIVNWCTVRTSMCRKMGKNCDLVYGWRMMWGRVGEFRRRRAGTAYPRASFCPGVCRTGAGRTTSSGYAIRVPGGLHPQGMLYGYREDYILRECRTGTGRTTSSEYAGRTTSSGYAVRDYILSGRVIPRRPIALRRTRATFSIRRRRSLRRAGSSSRRIGVS